jgi:predicted O-methyltransferase YrrM
MTIEEDAEWARKIQTQISKSKHEFVLVNTELSLWLNSRNKHNMDFDIVLIDGGSDEARKRSLEILPTLNPKAIYILDNSDREIFKEINFELKPLHTTRFSGLIRNPFQATETTFFYFEL